MAAPSDRAATLLAASAAAASAARWPRRAAARAGAGQGRLRLCRPDRRLRLDLRPRRRRARLVVERFGDQVETTFVENVAEGPDAERVIRQLAAGRQPADLHHLVRLHEPDRPGRAAVPATSSSSTRPATRPPPTSRSTTPASTRAAPCAAPSPGHMSKSGHRRLHRLVPDPRGGDGHQRLHPRGAARSAPTLQVKVVWVNSWYDPGKEARCRQGADRPGRRHHLPAHRQPGAAAGRRGARRARLRPGLRHGRPSRRNAQLTAIVDNWSAYYIERVQAVIDGTWETQSIWWGLKEGMVEMAPYGPAVHRRGGRGGAMRSRTGIIAGTLHPFTGPIENQAGEVVVAEGESLSDEQMLKMDWYVKGVAGLRPTLSPGAGGDRRPGRAGAARRSTRSRHWRSFSGLGRLRPALAPRDRRHRLDRQLVLLRPPRCQPAAPRRPAGRRRRRGLAGARRRLLPHGQSTWWRRRACPTSSPGSSGRPTPPGSAASSCWSCSTTLGAELYLIDPRAFCELPVWVRDRDQPGARWSLGWIVYDVLCKSPLGASDGRPVGALGFVFLVGARLGLHAAVQRPRRLHADGRADRHDHGRQRLLRDHPEPEEGRRRPDRRPRARSGARRSRPSSARCTTTI